ncbi:MAG: iron uptake protein [Rhodospirillales bacterium]|nr:iron uptake protein [Rhodospirillales bacterium]
MLLAIGGGYAVSAGLAALAVATLSAITTLPRSAVVVLASMLTFLVYLAILIWTFAERRLLRLCLILAAAGAMSWGGVFGLARLRS